MGVLKDTEITLMDGTTKKIEDLNSEDELLSCSISGISNKGRERDSIRWSNNNPELEKYKAKLDASWIDGQHIYMIINNKLSISYNHLIFFKDNEGVTSWDNAKVLRKGYFLLNDKFNYEIIKSIKRVKIKEDIISITLTECNTYFASGYLIHNVDPCDACDQCRWYSSILQPYGPHSYRGLAEKGCYDKWLSYLDNTDGRGIKHYDESTAVSRKYYDEDPNPPPTSNGNTSLQNRTWNTNGSTYELNRFYGEVIIQNSSSGWWVYKELQTSGTEYLMWKVVSGNDTTPSNNVPVANVHPTNIHYAMKRGSSTAAFNIKIHQTGEKNECVYWSLRGENGFSSTWTQMGTGNNTTINIPAITTPFTDEDKREGMIKILYGSSTSEDQKFRWSNTLTGTNEVNRPNGWMLFEME